MGARVGGLVGTALREPLKGVFRLSSGTKVGLGVLVTWRVGLGVAVGLAAGVAWASESLPPRAPQLSVKNSAKIAKTANLDTTQLPSKSAGAGSTRLNSIPTPETKQGKSVTKGNRFGGGLLPLPAVVERAPRCREASSPHC